MTEHPIVTQLSLACLPGYRAAMEELAEQRRLDAQALRAFALDRAAIAAGLIAREESREVPAPDRYWLDGHHPDEGSEDLREAWAGHPDAGVLEPVAMRSSTWPGLRWVVMAPGDDGELMVFTTQDEAETCRDTWPREEEDGDEAAGAAEPEPGVPVAQIVQHLEKLEAARRGKATPPIASTDAAEAPAQKPTPDPDDQPEAEAEGLEEAAPPAATAGENPAPPRRTQPIAGTDAAPAAPTRRGLRDLSDAEAAALRAAWEGGASRSELAARFNVAATSIDSRAALQNWKRGNQPALPEGVTAEELAEARQRRAKGEGARAMAEWFGWTITATQRVVAIIDAETGKAA